MTGRLYGFCTEILRRKPFFQPSLYSVILTEYVAIEPRVCVCVCVCVFVCVWKLCSPNGLVYFDETFYK